MSTDGAYRWKKHKPNLWIRFKTFLLSNGLQTAVQLATGTLFVSLFALVPQLKFPRSCLATIFFLAAELVVAQDNHVGSHIFAGSVFIGQLVYGAVWAGFAIMLARAPGVAYTTFLCVFGSLFFLPVAMLRSQMGAPALPINLGFAFTLVNGQFTWGAKSLWTEVIVPSMYLALLAAAGCLVSGTLVSSTLASVELRNVLSDTLAEVGMAISGYGSHMFVPFHTAAALADRGQADPSMHLKAGKGQVPIGPASRSEPLQEFAPFFEEPTLKEYYDAMWRKTNPATDHKPVRITNHGTASVVALLPRIQLCRRLMTVANAEPAFLSRHRMQLKVWSGAILALETFILRVGSLDSVLASSLPVLDNALLKEALGVDILPTLRVLYAHISACCGSLAGAMRYRKGLQRMDESGCIFGASLPDLKSQLVLASQLALRGNSWTRTANLQVEKVDPASLQVRAIMYVITLTHEIMNAMLELETAWEAAAAHQYTLFSTVHRPSKKAIYERDPAAKKAKESQVEQTTKDTLEQIVIHPSDISQRSFKPAAVQDEPSDTSLTEVLNDLKRSSMVVATMQSEDQEWQRQQQQQRRSQGFSSRWLDDEGREAYSDPPYSAHVATPSTSSRSLNGRRSIEPSAYRNGSMLGPSEPTTSRRRIRSSGVGSPERPIAKIEQEFRDATDTPDDALRQMEPPVLATDLSEGKPKPWQWSKEWAKNEVAFIGFLWPIILSVNVAISLWQIVQSGVIVCSGQGIIYTLRRNRKWHFFFKYWIVCAGSIVAIIWLQQDRPVVRMWTPLYVLFSAVVVMSERVETTVQKGCFRMLGTVVGGFIGWGVMYHSVSARSPYIIMAVNCLWVGMMGFLALIAQWRYGVFLLLSTTLSITLCQYQPDAPAGFAGTNLQFYGKLVSVGIGLSVVVAVCGLVFPWYTSEAVMETLGSAFQDSCNTLWEFQELFHYQTSLALEGMKEEAPEVAGQERAALDIRIGRRLAETQVLLQKEVVVWKHGLLAIPKIVYTCQLNLAGLLVRLVAVEATLQQAPNLTGSFSPTLYHWIAQPLKPYMDAASDAMCKVGATVSALLGGDERGHVKAHMSDHDDAMVDLVGRRMEFRREYADVVRRLHEAQHSGEAPPRNSDDAVRWLSFIFAFSEAMDRVMLFANCVRANQFIVDRCEVAVSDVKFRSWLSLKPRNHRSSANITKPAMRKPAHVHDRDSF